MIQRLLIVDSTDTRLDSALERVACNLEVFVVFALSAHHNMERLLARCLRFEPKLVIVSEPHQAHQHLMAASNSSFHSTSVRPAIRPSNLKVRGVMWRWRFNR
ncbi:hypothetical protein [Pseudomonas sp. efr-133-R2A-59]|uniref:hypothetical protein n=1 Tax=Pseudomonas sp. efr-133-R2A-59 TaxID=3040307 RepID=UPI0015B1A1C2